MLSNSNKFGNLIKSYRKQRGWTQKVLAERWNHSREYVSHIEQGKRKLEKQEEVYALADLLGIPQEQLAAVGKGPLLRKMPSQNFPNNTDDLLQTLIDPAQQAIKLFGLIHRENGDILSIRSYLYDLLARLNQAQTAYYGQFIRPALHMQACIHEILGKMAIERTQTQKAVSHFQAMYDAAEELGDSDLLVLALIHQSEMLRRRSQYYAMFRRMEAAENYISKHSTMISKYVQGIMWKASAINYFVYKDEQNFLRTIDYALEIAEEVPMSIDLLNHDFDKIEVLQTKAHGYTELWHPEKALEIYSQTDKLCPFRSLRGQSSYHIIKAQALCYSGDIVAGIDHAMKGMAIAENLHSQRYITRLRLMSDRLQITLIGKERRMKELREEILGTLNRMNRSEDNERAE